MSHSTGKKVTKKFSHAEDKPEPVEVKYSREQSTYHASKDHKKYNETIKENLTK
ncbi:hypothetical protein [Clostridium hydrogenum]|uniref:hypothetical protein n=1 Tax=Clostridium hydrogenum TaxID=2855764 RepID=UPI001F366966|nr:hypothetical protein [Clostridium hydrogenum]